MASSTFVSPTRKRPTTPSWNSNENDSLSGLVTLAHLRGKRDLPQIFTATRRTPSFVAIAQLPCLLEPRYRCYPLTLGQ